MGQSQSTGSKSQDTQGRQSEQKTDYYELLGVTRVATDDECASTLLILFSCAQLAELILCTGLKKHIEERP